MVSQNQRGNSSQYQSEKHKLVSQKNDMTIKALLRGCQREKELREWLGVLNELDASTNCKRFCAERINEVTD
jgi:hypothetical protein